MVSPATPIQITNPMTRRLTPSIVSVTRSTLARSKLSARVPAMAPTTKLGPKYSASESPTQTVEPDSSYTARPNSTISPAIDALLNRANARSRRKRGPPSVRE